MTRTLARIVHPVTFQNINKCLSFIKNSASKVVIEVTYTVKLLRTIDETAYEFWFENKDGSDDSPSLKDYCLRNHDEGDVEEEHDFLENDWSENDDIYHDMGASFSEGKICITIDGEEILNDYFLNLKEKNFDNELEITEPEARNYHFIGESYEKGNWFYTELEVEKFDLDKLSFKLDSIYESSIIIEYYYDGSIEKWKRFDTITKDHSFYIQE